MTTAALARGPNANLVHKWRRQAEQSARVPVTQEASATLPTLRGSEFVALPLATAALAIGVEVRRGASSVTVDWPVSTAQACATWLGSWLR